MTNSKNFEVIIIGGSYAGLSAAMALGRSLRNVLIIDSGHPCNRQTPHSHNFITHDGKTPREISDLARQQVEKYDTVTFFQGLATQGVKTKNGFEIRVQSNEMFTAQKLIFASGIKDIMPDINGFSECWGISVVHCPYCHGYEIKNEVTGILANGDAAMHYAQLVGNLTGNLTVLTNGQPDFTSDQLKKLEKHHIKVIGTSIDHFRHNSGHIESVVFKDGSSFSLKALYARVPFVQHTSISEKLGCELTEHGLIKIDASHKTTLDGVYACGDNSSMMRSVANAVATGNLTGAMVNRELTEEQF